MTEILRYRWTSFGPMLDEDGPFVLFVDAEAAIDEARSQEAKVHAATERWSPLSHLQGQRDALAAAVQRVEALQIYWRDAHFGTDHLVAGGWNEALTKAIAAIKGDSDA